MLEAKAHQQLKALLRQEGETRWPHHLTLSRLVARSLRRSDQTLVRLAPGSDPSWLLGLLVPLALHNSPVALVVSPALRQRDPFATSGSHDRAWCRDGTQRGAGHEGPPGRSACCAVA